MASVTDEHALITPPMYLTEIIHLCKLQAWMGSRRMVASFPSKEDQKGHNRQSSAPQEDSHLGTDPEPSTLMWVKALRGIGYDHWHVNTVKQRDARLEFRVCLRPIH